MCSSSCQLHLAIIWLQASATGLTEQRLYPPKGLIKIEDGKDLAETGLSLPDLLALGIGVGAASADLLSGHSNFTLNNLLACLIAVDILGVCIALLRLDIAQSYGL